MPEKTVREKTVLVIDDHPAIREAVECIFGMSGWHVITAPDGERGIALANELLPDAVLTDFRMTRGNGLEVIDRLRSNARTSGIPIVVMMFDWGASLKERCLEAGASAFVSKHVRPSQLVDAVSEAMERRAPMAA